MSCFYILFYTRLAFIPASSKVLVLSNTSRRATHSGNIVTLLSSDVENFELVSVLPTKNCKIFNKKTSGMPMKKECANVYLLIVWKAHIHIPKIATICNGFIRLILILYSVCPFLIFAFE